MPTSSVVDGGALLALLDPREEHHAWASQTFSRLPRPWLTCEPALTETFFQLYEPYARTLGKMLRAGTVRLAFDLKTELTAVLALRDKYGDLPMSLTDACLVRMSETLPESVIVTTDADFRIYRRHGRKVVPFLMP